MFIKQVSKATSILIFISAVTFGVHAQSGISAGDNGPEFQPLPSGYGDIELGMDIELVKEKLLSNTAFDYRGDPDVSMLPMDNRQVIDCDGAFYIDRGYFQFNDNRLCLITMVLDEEYIDHFSIYSALKEKYGEPAFLDPDKTVWQNDDVTVSLERPLSIKYIDRKVFQKLQQDSYSEESTQAMLRNDFVDSF